MANSEYLFKKAKIEAMSLASDLIRDNGFLLVDSTYISITDIINKSIILNKLDVFLSNDELVIIREKLLMSVLDYLDEFCRKIKFSEPNLGNIMIYIEEAQENLRCLSRRMNCAFNF